jgi:catechol 2,3-dioxygenase-like lactoylglutathione lyase family enzyme
MGLEVRGVTTLLEIFDMPRSIAFYRDALGFEVVATSQPGDDYTWALLRLDDAELMLNTAYDDDQRPPGPDPARVAGHADTGLFFACPDLDAAQAHFRRRGIAVEQPVVREYGMKQLWVTDPDGFRLCFQWPAA